MDNDRKSLISKIAAKGVVTPYESIYAQYLNRKYMDQQIPDIQTFENPYWAAENVPQILSEYQLKHIVTFSFQQDGKLYDAYRWAANNLSHFDSNIGDIGYKGTALLNEIRYMRNENVLRFVLKEEGQPIGGNLFEFSAFSQVHQKRMSFTEVLESFVTTFKFMIMSIDNILTLNYFLNGMFTLADLRCLQQLRMWLAKEKQIPEEETTSPLDIAHICFEQILTPIIESNHPDFTDFVEGNLRSFDAIPLTSFQEGSLQYVKETIEEILK